MSDTVKLIIEIPKETYKKITADKYAIYDKMYYSIKNGIPLDSVIAEIRAEQEKHSHPLEIERAIEILDNIGKAESEEV